MEVMSSLLLCALLALLPQALVQGTQTEWISNTNIKFNNSMIIGPKLNHKILLNLNAPPLVTKTNELQMVFIDPKCALCLNCMERALKAHKYNKYRPDSEELSDLITNTVTIQRKKRYVTSTPATDGKKEKKGKKKSKAHKTIIVTQYNKGGEVYALKVKESLPGSEHTEAESGACHVYSVNKVMRCNTPEGDGFIANDKRNANRKDKKRKEDEEDVTTKNPTTTRAPSKRQTDDVRNQMPENVMSSVEEFY